jgi:hypothetical protein
VTTKTRNEEEIPKNTASVWFYSSEDNHQNDESSFPWRRRKDDDDDDNSAVEVSNAVIHKTWNWCTKFVVPLNLCPWAASSVTTSGAVQLYVVPSNYYYNTIKSPGQLESLVESVAQQFVQSTASDMAQDMTKVAIAFLVLETDTTTCSEGGSNSNTQRWYDSFPEFYNWFINLEDYWIDQGSYIDIDTEEDEVDREDSYYNSSSSIYDLVTLAAFHPQWEFGSNDETDESIQALNFEKTSPYPTISMVWTSAIDAAGPEATERIGIHNQRLLQEEMTLSQLTKLYQQEVLNNDNDSSGDC